MGELFRIRSRKDKKHKKKNRMSQIEHELIYELLYNMGVEFEDDYTITFNYCPIIYNGLNISLPEHYSSIGALERDQLLFRPLKSEKHANILIDMFEDIFPKSIDCFEMDFKTIDNKKLYSGYFVSNNEKLQETQMFNIPNIASLKCVCIAKAVMEKQDFKRYLSKLLYFLNTI